MKAKTVFENIDFERGQDPKSSMNIGSRKNAFEIRELKYQGEWYGADALWSLLKDLNGIDPNNWTIIKTPIHKEQGGLAGNHYTLQFLYNHGFPGIIFKNLFIPFTDKPMIYHDGEYHPIKESHNFERGLSPKESIKIGLKDKFYSVIALELEHGEWIRGLELKDFFDEKIEDGGIIPSLSIKVKDEEGWLFNLGELKRDGYLGIRWCHRFLPFKGRITESFDFERYEEPYKNMQIGQKDRILRWLDEYNIPKDDILLNGFLEIDIINDLDITHKNLKKLPSYIKFNHIYGGFYAGGNPWESLDGFPRTVDGDLQIASPSVSGSKHFAISDKEIKNLIKVNGKIYNY